MRKLGIILLCICVVIELTSCNTANAKNENETDYDSSVSLQPNDEIPESNGKLQEYYKKFTMLQYGKRTGKASQQGITGSHYEDITENMRRIGFEITAPIEDENGGRVPLTIKSDVEKQITFSYSEHYDPDSKEVTYANFEVSIPEAHVEDIFDYTIKPFFFLAASLPYDSSDTDKSHAWIEENLILRSDIDDDIAQIGDAQFKLNKWVPKEPSNLWRYKLEISKIVDKSTDKSNNVTQDGFEFTTDEIVALLDSGNTDGEYPLLADCPFENVKQSIDGIGECNCRQYTLDSGVQLLFYESREDKSLFQIMYFVDISSASTESVKTFGYSVGSIIGLIDPDSGQRVMRELNINLTEESVNSSSGNNAKYMFVLSKGKVTLLITPNK